MAGRVGFSMILAGAALLAHPSVAEPGAPSAATAAANAAIAKSLPLEDREDFEFAARGFIESWPEAQIKTADGRVAWDFNAYGFLKSEAPPSVNPSLWRQAQLLSQHGLFKVTDRVYQIRGFDVSVMSVIVGETGLIIIDPLTSKEVAEAGLKLARKHLGDKPVRAVIYTHSHADHFGGVKGVVREEDVKSGAVKILAPEGFLEHAVSENVIAGGAMSRRAQYQFGRVLKPGPLGQVSSGIGQAVSSGTLTLIAPTDLIARTGEERMIDGVRMVFQMTPGTEAPSEMNFYFPQFKVLCLSENANASMHNILTPRGALVRDAKAWADYLDEALRLYGSETDVMITSHAWPRFGKEKVTDFIGKHRNAYKYLHDQSVRLMNQGLTPREIAEGLELPPVLARQFYNRGYYGTMSHNSKAVYQRYLGWYDANPANLNALPPEEAGKRYVRALGGEKRALAEAQRAYENADYRWAAELLNHMVFANPKNRAAREALARAHEQMGYQAESAIWRNMYLSAAQELRAASVAGANVQTGSPDVLRATPTAMLLDLAAVRLNPAKAGDQAIRVKLVLADFGETHLLTLQDRVLLHHRAGAAEAADVTLTMPRAAMLATLLAGMDVQKLIAAGQMKAEGDVSAYQRLAAMLEAPPGDFPIVLP